MKEKISKLKNMFFNFYFSLKPAKIEYIIPLFICFIMLISFAYNDLKSLTIWSTNMLDVIFDGNIADYYAYTAQNLYNAPHQYVSGTLFNFIPWAIWNIPIWIFQRFFHVPILTSAFSLIWSKLFLVACLVLTLYFAYKIVIELTSDKNKASWVVFLSLTFFYTYVGVFYAGQTDIEICLFGTIAIYMLFKKKEKWFLFFASLAISTKYFFLFPYIAIILLTEKNIFKIIKKLIIGILPVLLFSLIARGAPMYEISSNANPFYYMITGLINSFIPLFNSNQLSLFILGLIVVYFISYITVPKDDMERDYYTIYLTVASLTMLFLFTNYEFYRMILLMPFLFILLVLKPKFWKLNILLEAAICISSAITMIGHNAGYFFSSTNSMQNTLLPKLLNISALKDASVSELTYLIPNYHTICSIFSSLMLGSFLLILIINFPRFKEKYIDFHDDKMDRFVVWIRSLIIVPFVFYIIYRIL